MPAQNIKSIRSRILEYRAARAESSRRSDKDIQTQQRNIVNMFKRLAENGSERLFIAIYRKNYSLRLISLLNQRNIGLTHEVYAHTHTHTYTLPSLRVIYIALMYINPNEHLHYVTNSRN